MADIAKVTYYQLSGLSVEIADRLLVFDYWEGSGANALPQPTRITAEELKRFRQVLVFVSQNNPEHFDPVIYTWNHADLPITYVIADELPAGLAGHRMKPSDSLTVDGVEITAYDSTDDGVSYYVTAGGLNIFHAGGLNLWHWREESSLREIARAEEEFYAAMEPLKRLPMDVAMFPVDPRMGGLYDAGANHFVMTVKPWVFIPMHWQDRPEVAFTFARTGRTRYTEVVALTKPRETAVITFDVYELHVQIEAPEKFIPPGSAQGSLKEDDKNDPFSGTDLPVEDL